MLHFHFVRKVRTCATAHSNYLLISDISCLIQDSERVLVHRFTGVWQRVSAVIAIIYRAFSSATQ